MVRAAEAEGFVAQQIEAELGGDIHDFIRGASIDRQNKAEGSRLNEEKQAALLSWRPAFILVSAFWCP